MLLFNKLKHLALDKKSYIVIMLIMEFSLIAKKIY